MRFHGVGLSSAVSQRVSTQGENSRRRIRTSPLHAGRVHGADDGEGSETTDGTDDDPDGQRLDGVPARLHVSETFTAHRPARLTNP